MTSTPVISARGTESGLARAPSATLVTCALLAVIVIWGVGPPITKLISAPPAVGAFLRFWLMVPLIWGLAYASGRRVTLVVLKRTALAGALFGINMTFLFASLQHASVAVISVVQALTPGIVLLIAGPWLGERATLQHVLWTGLGITGVIVVVIGGDPEVSGDAFGFIAAAISTLSFVGYYVINRHMRSTTTIDPLQWMAGVTLFAALAVTPGAVITASPDDFGRVGAADWAYLGFIAVVVGVISHVTMSWAHAYVPASRSSPALLGANVVAIGVAWPLHDEPVTWVQVAGGIVVLASVLAILRKPTVAVVPRTRPSAEPDEPALPTV